MLTRAPILAFAVLLVSCGAVRPAGEGPPPLVRVERASCERADGVLLTPWIPRAPFTRALVSWNAPAGARLAVELRVAARGDASPWFPLATWPDASPTAAPAGAGAWGRVAVDEFVAMAGLTYDALQVRVREEAGRCERIFVATDAGPGGGPTEGPGPAPARRVAVEVPVRSQHDAPEELRARVCSPTSVAMALERAGIPRSTEAVARRAYDAAHDLYGNWPRAIATAAEAGLPGALARLAGWEELVGWLERGATVVASVTVEPGELAGAPYASTAGHLLVVRGLDGAGGVLVNDPAAPSRDSVARTYAVSEFEHVWFGRKAGLAYLFGEALLRDVPAPEGVVPVAAE